MTDRFFQLLSSTLAERTLIKAVLSNRCQSAPAEYERVIVRPVELRGRHVWQFSLQSEGQERHENLPAGETANRITEWFGTSYHDCHLFTREADYLIHRTQKGTTRIKRRPPTQQTPQQTQHDRQKAYIIPEGRACPFLVEIGVMTPAGKVRSAKYHKFRQVNRFLELVDDVVPSLPGDGPLRVVDFGCGKSSLTFALHHLLTKTHRRDVRLVGLDSNEKVIRDCRRLAEKLDCRGLTFETGRISEYSGVAPGERVDLVVALHACDTATDEALAQAVRWGTEVILAVPCCQHEIADRMDGRDVQAINRHGILKERFAALATDALRAELLEQHGYRTQVVEFIDMEHTAKNVLIRAVKRKGAFGQGFDVANASAGVSAEVQQLKTLLGLETFSLETLLE